MNPSTSLEDNSPSFQAPLDTEQLVCTTSRLDILRLLYQNRAYPVVDTILSYLDEKSLCSAELVSKEWHRIISEEQLWKKCLEDRVRSDAWWKVVAEKKGWMKYLFQSAADADQPDHSFYKSLFSKFQKEVEIIEIDCGCDHHNFTKYLLPLRKYQKCSSLPV